MNEATPTATLAASTGQLLGEGRLLANKVAIITGASRGIGAAAAGGTALAVPADVADPANADRLTARAPCPGPVYDEKIVYPRRSRQVLPGAAVSSAGVEPAPGAAFAAGAGLRRRAGAPPPEAASGLARRTREDSYAWK